MPTYSNEQRSNLLACHITLDLYLQFKSTLGCDRKSTDLGFSTDRIIRTCPADFIADVEKVVKRLEPSLSANERLYVKELLEGKDEQQTWLYNNGTVVQYHTISESARMFLGAEFRFVGLHQYATYKKPSDMR
jgi:hypothetical protein